MKSKTLSSSNQSL